MAFIHLLVHPLALRQRTRSSTVAGKKGAEESLLRSGAPHRDAGLWHIELTIATFVGLSLCIVGGRVLGEDTWRVRARFFEYFQGAVVRRERSRRPRLHGAADTDRFRDHWQKLVGIDRSGSVRSRNHRSLLLLQPRLHGRPSLLGSYRLREWRARARYPHLRLPKLPQQQRQRQRECPLEMHQPFCLTSVAADLE